MGSFTWIICFFLIFMQFSCTKCHVVVKRDSLGSSGSGPAPQTCGKNKFYCPYDSADRCKPRNQRCAGNNICQNPVTLKEEDCSETSQPWQYYVFIGHAKLFDSSSSKRKRSLKLRLEHQFVTFRGFTYEFGASYKVQVLDIADPKYKYKNGKHLNSKGIEQSGESYCNWEDANKVVEEWKSIKYRLFKKNCKHFAATLHHILVRGPCNRPASLRSKRQDSGMEFSQYIDRQLRNCSLSCCYDASSATALIHNLYSLLVLVFVTMTCFALL